MERIFKIDKQTYQDLQIFGEQHRSVFACFDLTVTAGGKEALQYLFYTPSSDVSVIESRQDAIRVCLQCNLSFPFEHTMIQDLSQYWRSAFSDADRKSTFWSTLSFWQIYSAEFYYKKCYILDTLEVLRQLEDFLIILNSQKVSIPEFHTIKETVAHCLRVMVGSDYQSKRAKVSLKNIHIYDEHIRVHLAEDFKIILDFIYQLDAYIAIAATAKRMQLTFPKVYQSDTVEIVAGLTKLDRPFIIISSHLTELSAEIMSYPNLRLCCMKTDLDKNNIPKFTYRLADGVANEKLGLWLLGRSGLLESVADLIAKRGHQ